MSGDNDINRRDVLKKTSIVAGISTVFAGSASGESTGRERPAVEKQYLSRSDLEAAIRTHAGDLLRELEQRDVLASASVEDLPLDRFDDDADFLNLDGTGRKVSVTSVPMDEGSERTALIRVSEVSGSDQIGLYVQPEAEKAYAIVHPDGDSSKRFKLDPSGDEVGTQDHGDDCGHKVECDWSDFCSGQCPFSWGECGYVREVHYDCYYEEGPYGAGCECYEVDRTCRTGEGCSCCYTDCSDYC